MFLVHALVLKCSAVPGQFHRAATAWWHFQWINAKVLYRLCQSIPSFSRDEGDSKHRVQGNSLVSN